MYRIRLQAVFPIKSARLSVYDVQCKSFETLKDLSILSVIIMLYVDATHGLFVLKTTAKTDSRKCERTRHGTLYLYTPQPNTIYSTYMMAFDVKHLQLTDCFNLLMRKHPCVRCVRFSHVFTFQSR